MSFNLKDFFDFWVFGALSFIFTICTFFVSLRVKAKINDSHEKRTIHENYLQECDEIERLIADIQKQDETEHIPYSVQKLLLHLTTAYPRFLKPFNEEINSMLSLIKNNEFIKKYDYFELLIRIEEQLKKEGSNHYE